MRYAIALFLLLSSCTSASLPPATPYRARLYDRDHRLFNSGTIVARRADGAELFQYDDTTAGDRGYQWIAAEEVSKRIRRGDSSQQSPISAEFARAGDP